MSFRNTWAKAALPSAVSLLVAACVGDASSQGSNDASADAPGVVDSGSADAPAEATADATVDATEAGPGDSGVCSKAQPGNTVTLPVAGAILTAQPSTSIKPGTYQMTDAYFVCPNCSTVSSSATGGLVVSIVGQTVTIERRVDLQEQSQPQQSVADRWTGTFDQLNSKLTVSRDCPTAAAATDWATLSPAIDAGKPRLNIRFGTEFHVKDKNSSSSFYPTFVFTQL